MRAYSRSPRTLKGLISEKEYYDELSKEPGLYQHIHSVVYKPLARMQKETPD
jgi:hypothetical protein